MFLVFCLLTAHLVLHCQGVCRNWHAYLPGNDSDLRHRLFSVAPVTEVEGDKDGDAEVDKEVNGETTNDNDEPKKDEGADADDVGERGGSDKNNTNNENYHAVPHIEIYLKISVDDNFCNGELPYLTFSLEVISEKEVEHCTGIPRFNNFSRNTTFHTMVKAIEWLTHLVNPNFSGLVMNFRQLEQQ